MRSSSFRAALLRAVLLLVPAALLCGPSAVQAEDVLVLDDGKRVRGWIVAEEEDRVRLAVDGGEIWYPRSRIARVDRDDDATARRTDETTVPAADRRTEHALLLSGEARAGVREFRVRRKGEGFQFEETVVFFDEDGRPTLDVHTVERCDAKFRPLYFQVREISPDGTRSLIVGQVSGDRLELRRAAAGSEEASREELPEGARFPFGAREMFLRRAATLGGKFEAPVFDTRDQRWRTIRYEDEGEQPVEVAGETVHARLVRRARGDRVERDWVDETFASHVLELNGSALRAVRIPSEVFGRVRGGDTHRPLDPDGEDGDLWRDPVLGFEIRKPGPIWRFELPRTGAGGALLAISHDRLFSSVDLLLDPVTTTDSSERATLERAAAALRRHCAATAPDFKILRDGFEDGTSGRRYWFEATATTKGERTKTLARVVILRGRVYRLLAAAPASGFDAVVEDLRGVLDSFQ